MTMGLNRTYHAHRFIFSFTFYFLFVPCGGLSWLPVSFLLHVKYTLSYRIVSYDCMLKICRLLKSYRWEIFPWYRALITCSVHQAYRVTERNRSNCLTPCYANAVRRGPTSYVCSSIGTFAYICITMCRSKRGSVGLRSLVTSCP